MRLYFTAPENFINEIYTLIKKIVLSHFIFLDS